MVTVVISVVGLAMVALASVVVLTHTPDLGKAERKADAIRVEQQAQIDQAQSILDSAR